MATTEVLVQRKWTGMNQRDNPTDLQATEAKSILNMMLTRSGELRKRPGFQRIAVNGTDIPASSTGLFIGYFSTSSVQQMLFCNGAKLLTSADGGATWTNRQVAGVDAGDVRYGIQYVDKFYMVRSNAVMLVWDGTTLTAIATSPSGTSMVVYKDRCFVVNTFEATGTPPNTSRVYYSDVAGTGGTTFLTANWAALANFVDVHPGDGDVVTALAILGEQFYIFKSNSLWTLSTAADPSSWVLRDVSPTLGTVSVWTVVENRGLLYFLARDGVYRTDGVTMEKLSGPMESPTNNLFDGNNPGFGTTGLTMNMSAAGVWDGRYVLALTFQLPGSGAAGQAIYVYDIDIDGWVAWSPAFGISTAFFISNFLSLQYPYVTGKPYAGLYMGWAAASTHMWRFGNPSADTTFTDNASLYGSNVTTRAYDFGDPMSTKRMKEAMIDWLPCSDGSGSAQWQGVQSAPPTQTLSFGAWTTAGIRNHLPLVGAGFFRFISLFLSDQDSSNFMLYSLTIKAALTDKRFANQ